MSFLVVIPARHASTRLPGKPLQRIGPKPMVQHVWERARASSADRVVVATDHDDIASACEAFGGECLLTRPDHPSGTDRLAEVVDRLELDGHGKNEAFHLGWYFVIVFLLDLMFFFDKATT